MSHVQRFQRCFWTFTFSIFKSSNKTWCSHSLICIFQFLQTRHREQTVGKRSQIGLQQRRHCRTLSKIFFNSLKSINFFLNPNNGVLFELIEKSIIFQELSRVQIFLINKTIYGNFWFESPDFPRQPKFFINFEIFVSLKFGLFSANDVFFHCKY